MKKNMIAIVLLMVVVVWGFYDSQAKPGMSQEATDGKVGVQVGNVAPNFELVSLDGKNVQLSDYRGKKVLVNFWATWCPPCRVEMPHMEKFYQDYKDKDFVILAVNLTQTEKSAEGITSFVKDFGLTFPVVLDEKSEVSTLYQVVAYPTSFIIDAQGVIRDKFQGAIDYDTMKKAVTKLK